LAGLIYLGETFMHLPFIFHINLCTSSKLNTSANTTARTLHKLLAMYSLKMWTWRG